MTTIRQRRLRTRCKYREDGIVIFVGGPLLLLERWHSNNYLWNHLFSSPPLQNIYTR